MHSLPASVSMSSGPRELCKTGSAGYYLSMSNAQRWYRSVVGDDAENAVAQRSGVRQTTLNRQLRQDSLSAESAVKIARAYGSDLLEALVAVGLIGAPEAVQIRADVDIDRILAAEGLARATDVELAQEILRRAKDVPAASPLKRPISAVTEMPTAAGTVSDEEIEAAKQLPFAARERTPGPDSQDVE